MLVRQELWTYFKGKLQEDIMDIPKVRNVYLGGLGFDESDDELESITFNGASTLRKMNATKRRAMDLFCRKHKTAIEKKKEGEIEAS